MYERQNKFEDELIADTECIGGLLRFGIPDPIKQSYIYSYRFPPQEYKLHINDLVTNTATRKSTGSIVELDDLQGIVKIKLGIKSGEPPETMSIGPGYPFKVDDIRTAIYRVANKDGTAQPRLLTMNDILVVTPYNVQANYLQSVLPQGAKVGTVDKFQGQEAPVVIVSMVTSSVEDLPKNIEFFYSKNRMNVAISRAQCLAVVVANPSLKKVIRLFYLIIVDLDKQMFPPEFIQSMQ